jgi:signal transduction histidine kinase
VLLLARFAVASRARRRALAPIVAVGVVWLGAFAAYQVAAYLVVTDMSFWNTVGWVLTGARIALPLAFLLALALAQMYAGGALERMMRLRVRPDQAELEQVAAEALGDPALRLASWTDDAEEWIGTDGAVVAEGPVAGRAWRELRSDGRPVAALSYDDVLDEDPELVDAAATAILLSVETTRLHHEKREMTSQLHDARRRASTAGLSERRRLERDLHDGAQQQLIAARIQLNLLSERAGGNDMSGELEQLGRELDDALDEIRSIAHSTYPALLRTEGIRAALAHSVNSDPRARLDCGRLRRHPELVEVAVYFSALEALQNACKHCPPGTEITVKVWDDSSALCFAVVDDGPGFDPNGVSSHGGLAGITDRMASAGGTLEVDSAPGGGTRITGSAGSR